MTDEQRKANKEKQRIENMTDEQKEADRAKLRIENMTDEQKERKRERERKWRNKKMLLAQLS